MNYKKLIKKRGLEEKKRKKLSLFEKRYTMTKTTITNKKTEKTNKKTNETNQIKENAIHKFFSFS